MQQVCTIHHFVLVFYSQHNEKSLNQTMLFTLKNIKTPKK